MQQTLTLTTHDHNLGERLKVLMHRIHSLIHETSPELGPKYHKFLKTFEVIHMSSQVSGSQIFLQYDLVLRCHCFSPVLKRVRDKG